MSAGVAVRTLQEFLRDHCWSFAAARTQLQQHIAVTLASLPGDDLGTVGLHDETGTVKDGSHTPGAQRQYCGEVGKLENCIVTVHTGVAKGRYKTLFELTCSCRSPGTKTGSAAAGTSVGEERQRLLHGEEQPLDVDVWPSAGLCGSDPELPGAQFSQSAPSFRQRGHQYDNLPATTPHSCCITGRLECFSAQKTDLSEALLDLTLRPAAGGSGP